MSLETYGHLSGQGENEESPTVQSGRALPVGRCASPPWDRPNHEQGEDHTHLESRDLTNYMVSADVIGFGVL